MKNYKEEFKKDENLQVENIIIDTNIKIDKI